MKRALLLITLTVGASAAPRESRAPIAPSQCSAQRAANRNGKHDKETPKPGVPLWFGIETGMTRTEVHQVDPHLAGDRGASKLRFQPDLPMTIRVDFEGEPERAVSLDLSGRIVRFDRLVTQLTKLYGKPLLLNTSTTHIDLPVGVAADSRAFSTADMKWCDGERAFKLSGGEDSFSLSISAETQ